MFRFVVVSFLAIFISPVVSLAGDCNKTVMGGGCTTEVDAGVAAHMRSQPQVKPVAAKAKATEVNAKESSVLKNVKMSKTTNQKPQI